MLPAEPGAPRRLRLLGALRHPWLRALLPHALTAAVAVAVTFAIQAALPPTPPAPTPAPLATPASPTPRPTAPPEPTPTAAPPLAEGISRQELADLRAEIDRLWATTYLTRALSQVADAEATLRTNDLEGVDLLLVGVDDSLGLAYDRAADSAKNPIEQLRRETGTLRDDLYLRPEGMDARLLRLRQTILALIEERR